MNIKLSVESETAIKEMGSMSIQGRTRIILATGEQIEEVKPKTYWFMPFVFEETDIPTEFMMHQLPESIVHQIVEFINR